MNKIDIGVGLIRDSKIDDRDKAFASVCKRLEHKGWKKGLSKTFGRIGTCFDIKNLRRSFESDSERRSCLLVFQVHGYLIVCGMYG
jgi:hypothetical protein